MPNLIFYHMAEGKAVCQQAVKKKYDSEQEQTIYHRKRQYFSVFALGIEKPVNHILLLCF